MSTTRDILRRLSDLGVATRVEGSDLMLRPAARVPADLAAEARGAKGDLLAALCPSPAMDDAPGGLRTTVSRVLAAFADDDPEVIAISLDGGPARPCGSAASEPPAAPRPLPHSLIATTCVTRWADARVQPPGINGHLVLHRDIEPALLDTARRHRARGERGAVVHICGKQRWLAADQFRRQPQEARP